nr:DNA topoisomerase 3-alpha [Polyrhizophydium stewartii]
MRVLCVAEKPSISKAVTEILSGGRFETSPTPNKYIKNYEFDQTYQGRPCTMVMTALLGHLMETEFPAEWKTWRIGTLHQLFRAPVVKRDMGGLADNLRAQARRAQMLVIWTDCDREGENIGAEAVEICRQTNPNIVVKRARFSVVQQREIRQAWSNLSELDWLSAAAVDARSELDLRIGAVFTRFQTLKLTRRFRELEKQVLSYGPCQFPTLGFVVDRYRRAKEFVEEPFWQIDVEIERDGLSAKFSWDRGHLFDQHLVVVLYELCLDDPVGTITKVEAKPKSKWAPLPLTTVELQKVGSRFLRMSSDRIMTVAEALYNQGIISYPRTETDCFDDNFELLPLIEKQTQDPAWGAYAMGLLNGKFTKPRKGKNNDQAHPPIHPVRGAFNLQGDERKVFDFVTRRFLACCSAAAKGQETIVNLALAGETFTSKGLMILERNFLEVYPFEKWSDCDIPTFHPGEQVQPTVLEIHGGKTSRPQMLTEADLITLMDKSGIGTDATIHEHIKKILEREYAIKQGVYFYPTTLGMALVTAYDKMDIELSLSKPFLRSLTEASMKRICDGSMRREDVVNDSIEMYLKAFVDAFAQAHMLEQECAHFLGHAPDAEPQGQFVRNCTKCQAPMLLRAFANNGANGNAGAGGGGGGAERLMIGRLAFVVKLSPARIDGLGAGCSAYPACREAMFLPSFVTAASVSESQCTFCSQPNNGVFRIRLTFKPRSTPPTITQEPMPRYPNQQQNEPFQNPLPTQTQQPRMTVQQLAVSMMQNGGPNKDRQFYACSKNQDDETRCNMFQWADEPPRAGGGGGGYGGGGGGGYGGGRGGGGGGAPPGDRPNCNCGVEASFATVRKEGPNLGRQFYSCVKMRGDPDHCGYFAASTAYANALQGGGPTDRKRCHCNLVVQTKTSTKDGPNKGRQFNCCPKTGAHEDDFGNGGYGGGYGGGDYGGFGDGGDGGGEYGYDGDGAGMGYF